MKEVEKNSQLEDSLQFDLKENTTIEKPNDEESETKEYLQNLKEKLSLIESTNKTIDLIQDKIADLTKILMTTNKEEAKFVIKANEKLKNIRRKAQSATKKFLSHAKIPMLVLFLLIMEKPHDHPDKDPSIEIAKSSLVKYGITKEQKQRYIPGVSEFINKYVTPFNYKSPMETGKDIAKNLWYGKYNTPEFTDYTDSHPEKKAELTLKLQNREDAWRLYLGLEQTHDTFGISDYTPQQSTEQKYYFKINKFLENYQKDNEHYNKDILPYFEENQLQEDLRDENPIKQLIKDAKIQSEIKSGSRNSSIYEADYGIVDRANEIMFRYKLSLGEDEKGKYISYFDKWNVEGIIEGEEGVIGTPFEIYDRIYYNPETFQLLTSE